MKKTLITLLFLSLAGFASAQQTSGCLDIPYGLSRGMESSHVLALQNFLYAKGLLKATPNGYFGPATFMAVKAYQKTAGFSQVGIVGPATRALIKKTTCQTGTVAASSTPAAFQGSSTVPSPVQSSAAVPPAPRPELEYVDPVTVFSGGETDWEFDLHGINFSSTTNTVLYKNTGNGTVYVIGVFGSPDGKTITLPKSLGNTRFSCGTGCFQILSPGPYEISVNTPGGQTVGKYMEIRPFTIQSQTGTAWAPLSASATNVKIGSVSFSTPAPVIVKSVGLVVSTSTISPDGLSIASYNDPLRREVLAPDVELYPLQTMIVEANVTTSNQLSGTVTAYFTVQVEDYVARRKTTFASPYFLATVQGAI